MVVHNHHGGIPAGAHTLALFEGKQTIGGGVIKSNPQLRLKVARRLITISQSTRQIRTDRKLESTRRLQVIHRVETGNLMNRDRWHIEIGRNRRLNLGREPADLPLRNC